MTCANDVFQIGGAQAARALALVWACGFLGTDVAVATWFPLQGTKDGGDAAVEAARLYTGPQLSVFGGTLDFLGSATINGPILVQEQNRWGDPVVTVAGVFNVNGSSFRVLDGSTLVVNGIDPGSVATAGDVLINGGSQVTIGPMMANSHVFVHNSGSSLHVMGDYTQTSGDFKIEDSGAFEVDGTFNFDGAYFLVNQGSTFSVGDPASGSVTTAGEARVAEGSQVTIGPMMANSHVFVHNSGSSLHVMGDYTQTSGDFKIEDSGAFEVDGTFNFDGAYFLVNQGSTFSVGDPASGSVTTAGEARVAEGSQVTIGPMTANSHVFVHNSGSSLHVMGDYTQTSGDFKIEDSGAFEVDGTFNFDGAYFLVNQGSTFSVGDPASGSVTTAGEARVAEGSQVTIGPMMANSHVFVHNSGSSLHVMGDYTQTSGDFKIQDSGAFEVDGTFNVDGAFFFVHQGSTFSVGDPASGSVSTAGEMIVGEGSQVTIGSLMAGSHVSVHNSGSSLHVMGDYTQTSGDFKIQDSAAFEVDASFEHTGDAPGNLFVSFASTFRVGQFLRLSDDVFDIDGRGTVGGGDNILSSTLRVGDRGSLEGNGTLVADLLVDGGAVQPGAPIGALTVESDYTQTSDGVLEVELGGFNAEVNFDQIHIIGGATLAGRLDIKLSDGFTPIVGDSWTVLTANTIVGEFEDIAPCGFDVGYRNNTVVITYAAVFGDINCDRVVDGADLGLLLSAWGTPAGDLNGDGTTDGADFGILLSAWTG